MNRRNFIAGLLATTAAVPLAKVVPVKPAPMIGLDLAEAGEIGGYTGYALFQSPPMLGKSEIARMWYAHKVDQMLNYAASAPPVPKFTVWFDEATDFTEAAWNAMVPASVEAKPHDATDDGT